MLAGFLLPSLVAASTHTHHASRLAHARNTARLVREAEDARVAAEARNLERGLNFTMSEWQEMYGRVDDDESVHQLTKRGSYHGRATFYSPANNACGGGPEGTNDNIVALNFPQYGDDGNDVSKYCFKEIVISYGSKTETAQIVDACEACPYGGLDFSPGLFAKFANPTVGVLYVNWYFADDGSGGGGGGGGSGSGSGGGGGGGDSSPTHSSNTPQPTPTTTYHPSSSSAAATTSSVSSSSVSVSASANSTSSAAPSAGGIQQSGPSETANWDLQGGNFDDINQLVMALGNILGQVAASGSA